MADFKDAGVMLKLAIMALEKQGIDTEQVYKSINIQKPQWQDPTWRTPHNGQTKFWETVETLSGDPFIGLHLGEHMPVFRGQVVEYLFLSSPTFGEGLRRALGYQRLLTDAMSFVVNEDDHTVTLQIKMNGSENGGIRQLNDCLLLNILKFFKWATDGKFHPVNIKFAHPRPESVTEYLRFFACPMSFDNVINTIEFEKELLDTPSLHAEPDLLKLHEQCAHDQMQRIERQDLVSQVRQLIGEMLDDGNANIERIAQRIGMSSRHLRRLLDEQGTSFNQLLAGYRFQLAKRLLADTKETIEEIVFLTGFSEPSTFYRAFKRWSGQTPLAYRNDAKAKLKDIADAQSSHVEPA